MWGSCETLRSLFKKKKQTNKQICEIHRIFEDKKYLISEIDYTNLHFKEKETDQSCSDL